MGKPKYLIVIAGPTAVGKTKMAIQLAQHFEAEIFSADSRQVFKEMNIGTAKPSLKELAGIQHHFINQLSIHEETSAGLFERFVIDRLKTYYEAHDVAILTGGTGLYIKAVLEGLDEFPPVSKASISTIEKQLEEFGIQYLQQLLKEKDPEAAAFIEMDNPRRLVRALSVIDSSGQKFSNYHKNAAVSRDFIDIKITLTMDRDLLYDRINQRVDLMLEEGLVEEAKSLHPNMSLKALDTVGYRELFSYFDGELSLEEAINKIKTNSRRYAKRQITWFNNQYEGAKFESSNFIAILRYIEKQMSAVKL